MTFLVPSSHLLLWSVSAQYDANEVEPAAIGDKVFHDPRPGSSRRQQRSIVGRVEFLAGKNTVHSLICLCSIFFYISTWVEVSPATEEIEVKVSPVQVTGTMTLLTGPSLLEMLLSWWKGRQLSGWEWKWETEGFDIGY